MYHHDDLISIPIEYPKLSREVGIVYHKEKNLGKAASGFIELVIAYVKSIKSEEAILIE